MKPTLKATSEGIVRPVNFDYEANLRKRFGSRASLLRIDQMGGTGEKRRPYQVAEGVAIINISGVLVANAEWWDETEYSEIIQHVSMASDDADVKGILLRVNSPGGQTDGAFEAAASLAEAGKKKPMWAVADGMAYSAAYLLASQAAKIYTPQITGGVGSIGVYAIHIDHSGLLEQLGLVATFVSEGEGKIDGNPYQPLSENALKSLQAQISRLYEEFVGSVARGRNMPEAAVKKLGAYTYQGSKAALGAGLADAAGSLEDAWVALASSTKDSDPMQRGPSTKGRAVSAQADVPEASADGHDSTEKEVQMDPKETTAADNKQTAGVTQAEHDRLIAEARASANSEASEIVAMCSLAGHADKAGGFLSSKKSRAEVLVELQNLKAKADTAEVDNKQAVKSSVGTDAQAFGGLLVKSCESIAASMKGVN